LKLIERSLHFSDFSDDFFVHDIKELFRVCDGIFETLHHSHGFFAIGDSVNDFLPYQFKGTIGRREEISFPSFE
jgi:hypothetical protein